MTQGTQDGLKRAAAEAALAHVRDGMRLGLGSGSTAEAFLYLLGARFRDGLSVTGVPTSERTRRICEEQGIALGELEAEPLDLTIDGADEIGPRLALVKGGGGALLREKMVASHSAGMIVIADESKVVNPLGRFPLPIEVVPFGLAATRAVIQGVLSATVPGPSLTLRLKDGEPYRTDGGNLILDAACERIEEPRLLAERIGRVPGVVEHGLFVGIASLALVAGVDGVREIGSSLP